MAELLKAPVRKLSQSATSSPCSAVPSLDSKVEYLDGDGIPRRSETVTRRMMQRGHSLDKAVMLTKEDQLHSSLDTRKKLEEERGADHAEALRELERKQAANMAFKAANKRERQQWIDESDEYIATRLEIWYDGKYVPKDEAIVDVTEVNTPQSPSKSKTFIDAEGNLRRPRTASTADTSESPAPSAELSKLTSI
ncbi:hypothetical protein ATCC90586_000726 [Pythium insidiosum]|nr:hypothetical protein ATCC90586_000726 [Pythium insidiosum]